MVGIPAIEQHIHIHNNLIPTHDLHILIHTLSFNQDIPAPALYCYILSPSSDLVLDYYIPTPTNVHALDNYYYILALACDSCVGLKIFLLFLLLPLIKIFKLLILFSIKIMLIWFLPLIILFQHWVLPLIKIFPQWFPLMI